MVKQELRKLISDIDSIDPYMVGFQLSDCVLEYNRLLENVQNLYPNNNFIQTKIPIKYSPLSDNSEQVAKIIKSNCKSIIENLSSTTNSQQSQPQNITITIGSLNGNFSMDNLISTIQNSNIGNSTEIVQHINEFRQELNKTNPDKKRLRNILDSVKNVGEGVVSALLAEVGKKILGI